MRELEERRVEGEQQRVEIEEMNNKIVELERILGN